MAEKIRKGRTRRQGLDDCQRVRLILIGQVQGELDHSVHWRAQRAVAIGEASQEEALRVGTAYHARIFFGQGWHTLIGLRTHAESCNWRETHIGLVTWHAARGDKAGHAREHRCSVEQCDGLRGGAVLGLWRRAITVVVRRILG